MFVQLFVDPQQFDDQLEVWTLTIQKSTVIPPSLMVLFLRLGKTGAVVKVFNLYIGQMVEATIAGFVL